MTYVPDQWDSIFESYDQEEEQRERKEEQEKKDWEAKIAEGVNGILARLKEILDQEPRHETPKEIKQLFSPGQKGFAKGNTDEYARLLTYAKEPKFVKTLKEYCEKYIIDKYSYQHLLKRVYKPDGSWIVTDMRQYLTQKYNEAPYPPLKKMNYPLAVVFLALVFFYQILAGSHPALALIPTFFVGVHWFLYRQLYPKYGCLGTHLRISFVMMILVYIAARKLGGENEITGPFLIFTAYLDFFIVIAFAWGLTNKK